MLLVNVCLHISEEDMVIACLTTVGLTSSSDTIQARLSQGQVLKAFHARALNHVGLQTTLGSTVVDNHRLEAKQVIGLILIDKFCLISVTNLPLKNRAVVSYNRPVLKMKISDG